MNTRMPTALLAGLLAVFPGGTPGRPQESGGIPEWKWRTPLASLQARLNLREAAVTGRTVRYLSNLTHISSVPVRDCQLEFTEGMFSGLAFTTQGREYSRGMLAVLEGTFGAVRDSLQTGFQWLAGETHIAYDEDSRGDAYVYLYAVSLQPAGARSDSVRQTGTRPH
jgi:hypothetical protein